jgi:ubiquitin-protein ligase
MEINKITIKRITGDINLFQKTNPTYFDIYPNKDNILEIYFLLIGQPNTPYEGGHYICKLVHNPSYPFKAPDYYVLTPNGRFMVNKKICITNSSYHQDDWAPAAWNLISILEGFSSIWHSDIGEDKHGISHLTNTPESQIKEYTNNSIKYNKECLSQIYYNFKKALQ